MPTTAELKNALVDLKPLHAVAGAGDLAVAKLREVPSRLSELKVERKVVRDRTQVLQDKVRGTVADVRAKAEDAVSELRGKNAKDAVTELRGKVEDVVKDARAKAEDAVSELRGKNAKDAVTELRGKAEEAVKDARGKAEDVVKDARELQRKATGFAQDQVSRASGVVGETAGKASETYSELAARGKDVVNRVRSRQAAAPVAVPVVETAEADEVTVPAAKSGDES